jgi:hypothetical protein
MSLTYRVLTIFIVVAIVMSLVLGLLRLKVENENRRVDIMLDYADIQYLSRTTGKSAGELLNMFKDKGVSSVVVNEYTANSFVSAGKVVALSGKDILSYYYMVDFPNVFIKRLIEDGAINQYHTYFLMDDVNIFEKLKNDFSLRLSENDVSIFVFSSYSGTQRYGIDVNASLDEALSYNLGFLEEDLTAISNAGLNIVSRFTHIKGCSLERSNRLFEELAQTDSITMFMFSAGSFLEDDEFLGKVTEHAQNLDVIYGDVEFENPEGESNLIGLMDFKSVRVHTINPAEMSGYTVSTAVDRFVRAVRERNIRSVYLRLFATDDDILEMNLEYVGVLRDRLVETGHIPASSSPFRHLSSDLISLSGIGLGVASAGLLFAHLAFGLSGMFAVILLLCFILVCGILILSGHGIFARQIMALLAAVIFPCLGVFYWIMWERKTANSTSAYGFLRALLGSLWRLGLASVISFIGGMFVVGLLADTLFMLNVKGFFGVKLAYVLPLVIIALCYFYRFVKGSNEGVFAAFRRAIAEPIRYKHVFVWGILAVGALIYIIRSGNNSIIPVTAIETRIRSLLEHGLYARPRMKEVLIGHPFLLLAAYILLRQRAKGLLLPVLILGTVGQISMINSFAHIHTPLLVTLSRTGYGLIFGAIVGVVLIIVFEIAFALNTMGKAARGVTGD